MQKKMSEFDRIRESIARIRALNESTKPKATTIGRLNEDIAGTDNQDFQQQKESFQQAVPGDVEFGNYVSNKEEITLRGELKIGANGQPLRFVLTTKNKDGLYIECTQFQADGDAIDSITKLRAYFDVWYGQNLEKLNGSTSNTGAAESSSMAPPTDTSGGLGGGLPPM